MAGYGGPPPATCYTLMKIQDFPPKYQYPSTCTVQFSWFNAVRNNESYYLAWKDVAGTTRTTQSLPFGAILSIKTDVPNPVVTSANPTGFNVVRARDNKVVASKPSFRLDNQFSQMVVAWTDQQNNIFTDNVGMFGPYGQACAFGWNLAYPYSTVSNAITPNVTIVDNNNKLVSGATGTATYSTSYNNGTRQITSTTAYATRTQCWSPSLSTGIPGRAPVALPYQDISSYQFSCNYQSKPSLKVTVPNGNLIAVATSVFFICINDAQQQARLLFPAKGYLLTNQVTAPQAHPSLPSPNHDIFPVIPVIPATTDRNLDLVETSGTKEVGERRLQGSSLPGGYHVYYGYSTPSGAPARSACRDVTEATYYALGQCTQTGLQTSLIRSAVVSNGVTRFFGTDYASTNCDPSTAGLQRQSEGVDNTTVCQPSPQGTTLKSFGFTKTLPPLPAGQVAKYSYANAAQCAAGTAPLQATYSVPNRCIAYYGNAYQQNLCAANVTVTSSTGGFVVHRFYGDAACQAAPLVSHFHQLNVCGQSMDKGSFRYVPQKGASGSSVTAFMKMAYASDDCSGPLSTPPPGPTNATNFNTTTYTWQSNAMPAGDTSMVCSPSGLADPNMAYATVVYAPVVLGFSSGWGVARFNSLGACNALDTTKLFGGKQYTAGCVQDADVASNFISVTGCPGVTTTPTTVTYTYAFQGVSLATAQSAAFQSNCILVVAAYAGVPASSVSITSVVVQSGVVIVKVATTASNTNVAALNNLHRNAGPVIVNALGTAFPGLGLASVPAASTGPPTPAAVSSALSSSGAALTASLAAAYPGIVVGNAVTTVTAAGVSATQNIPSGVTVAQAQSSAFQAAFVASVASVAGVSTSSVTGYTATQGRRLLAGVNVAYTVNTVTVGSELPYVGGSCFAGSELLTLENGATKAMADVAVGDRVLTVNAQTGTFVYSDVVYVPHGKNTEKAVFVTVATETGRDVKMTANHVLPAGACETPAALPYVAASAVSVGDCVQTVTGRERVVSVSTAAGEGIYTAIAMEELVVVNGIVATPYGGVNPVLANVYYNLHRLMYQVGAALRMPSSVQAATEGLWRALFRLAGPSTRTA